MLRVIYNDQCGFCIRSLKVCRSLDIGRRLQFEGSTTFRLKPEATEAFRLKPEATGELANADFENAIFAVTPDGRVTRGFFACRRIIREVPLLWPLLPLAYFPGTGLVGPRIYAWVARNRHRLGCESEICDLPEPGRPRL
jgi:predicted DCC family thiol-disulfide oxidoreductase YuxK